MRRLRLHENEDTCVCTYGEVTLKVSVGFLRKILSMQEKRPQTLQASKKGKKRRQRCFY